MEMETARLPLLFSCPQCVVAALGEELYGRFQSHCLFGGGLHAAEGEHLHKEDHEKGGAALFPMPKSGSLCTAAGR